MDGRELDREIVVQTLWDAYKETDEYKNGRVFSISANHPLVIEAEEKGLRNVIEDFLHSMDRPKDLKASLLERKATDWLEEWKTMHGRLFEFVLKDRGRFRKAGEDVRFGDPGDEELHHVPKGYMAQTVVFELADQVSAGLANVNSGSIRTVCEFLADVHYQFVRTHPFLDGNGRIARVLVDQLSVSLGFVPILAGFPRHDKTQTSKYHAAIRACADDRKHRILTEWTLEQMQLKLDKLA